MGKLEKVYICSPYMGDIENNVRKAIYYSRLVAFLGLMPVTPQIYSTRFLDDNIPKERQLGLAMGLDLLSECQELWAFGLNNPSVGIQGEINYCVEHNIPIYDGYQKMAEEVVAAYCNTHGILQPSIKEPIFYFAALGYSEEKIRQMASYEEIMTMLTELENMVSYKKALGLLAEVGQRLQK